MAKNLLWAAVEGDPFAHLFEKVGEGEFEPLCDFVVSVPEIEKPEKQQPCPECAHLQLTMGEDE